jgi:HlyD family secretion protein
LGDGFRVAVSIVTRSQPDAVVVPVSAVYPLPADAPPPAPILAASGPNAKGPAPGVPDAARHAVFVAEQGHARQVAVTLGGRNGSVAWIRAGLTPGQQVIVYPPAAVRDGVRIAARKV